MQLKRAANGDIVMKYIVTVDGYLGAEPPAAGRFLWFCSKQEAIFTSFSSHLARFKAIRVTKLLKFRSYFKEELNLLAPLAPPYFSLSLKCV